MDKLAQYFKERVGFDSIVRAEGFIAYRLQGDECWIYDIFVDPDFRKRGVATELAEQVEKIAINGGCKYLCGSTTPSSNGSTDSLKFILAYGMSLHSAGPNIVTLRKEI